VLDLLPAAWCKENLYAMRNTASQLEAVANEEPSKIYIAVAWLIVFREKCLHQRQQAAKKGVTRKRYLNKRTRTTKRNLHWLVL
jgi:hypothetical protein